MLHSSHSAIARLLRRLRGEGWIARTIALLSSRLLDHRLRAFVLVQLNEHADRHGKDRLLERLGVAAEVQFVYEISGTHDLVAMLDCTGMDAFVGPAEEMFVADSTESPLRDQLRQTRAQVRPVRRTPLRRLARQQSSGRSPGPS